ncbi:MAG TPA: energy transducer TonB [Terriglobia bacterium]|nr:energy transducer TonB [Terriglobia bacterium]
MPGSLQPLFNASLESGGESSRSVETTPGFALLQPSSGEKKRRRTCFGASLLIQALLASAFLWLLTLPPALREGEEANKNWNITLLAPPPPAPVHKPIVASATLPRPAERTPPHQVEPAKVQALPKTVPTSAPTPVLPHVVHPVTAKLEASPPRLAPPPAPNIKPNLPKWEPQTHVGAFDSRPAVAALKLPRAKVQTGGFGSPDGLPGQAEGGNHGNVPHVGSFDRPEGSGSGNGTGGAKGAQVLVARAGFGDGGVSGAVGHGSARDVKVHSGSFPDAQSMTQASPQAKPQAPAATFEPVVITAKPDPVYTAEARQLQVQGEVVVRVVFTAAGRVQVVGVQQGLGHGLDEAAVRAVEQIQFKPARRGGQPVDATATLHVMFQLAD